MSKTRMGKRVASLLLSLVMMLSLLPTTVYATTAEPGETETQDVISEEETVFGQNTEDGNVPDEGETGTDDLQPEADNAEGDVGAEENAVAPQSGEEGADTALLAAYNAEGEEEDSSVAGTGRVGIGSLSKGSKDEGFYDNDSNKAHLTYTYYTDKVCYSGESEAGASDQPTSYDVSWVESVTITDVDFNQLTDTSDDMTALKDVVMNGRRTDTPQQFKDSIEVKFVDCTFTQTDATLMVNKIMPCNVTKYSFEDCTFQGADGQHAITLNASEDTFDSRAISYEITNCTINSNGRGINLIASTEKQTLGNHMPKVVISGNTFELPTTDSNNMAVQLAGVWDNANLSADSDPLIEITDNDITAFAVVRIHDSMGGNTNDSAKYIAKLADNTLSEGCKLAVAKNDESNETVLAIAAHYNSESTEGKPSAEVNGVKYDTLANAIAAAKDGDTVTLLADCSGDGIKVDENKFADQGLTVDFDGHSYTVGGVLVGSSGTASNGFQLLAGNTITFENGTIYGDKSVAGDETTEWTGAPAIMIQNYCDLTLKNMTVVGGKETCYTMSNNNGEVVIEDTTIEAGQGTEYGPFAFDVCRFSSYPSVAVTVKGNSRIEGNVEISGAIGAGQSRQLNIEGGTFTGTFKISGNVPANIAISGGTFSEKPDEGYLAEGFTIEANSDGTYGVKEGADGYVEDENGNVTISTEAGLFWFAKQVNEKGNTFSGKTVTLAEDITLTERWTPIGIYTDSKTHFKGTFDGQNHTVSGVDVLKYGANGVGFFGKVYTGTVKNLTVEGTVTAHGCNYVGGIVGHGYATITNCTFKGSVGDKTSVQVGGIAGSGGFTVTNCSVYGNVTADTWAGGIVGNCQDGGAYTGCYVEGTISAESTYWGGGAAGITPVPLYPSQKISGCYSNTVVKVAGEEVNCPIIASYNNPIDYNGYSGDLQIYDNSWNKQKNSNDSYPVYAEKDGEGGVLIEGKTVSRDNNLVMLEDDLQYVSGNLSNVRIMSGSTVTRAQVDALAVAEAGDKKYTSLETAIAAATDGDTVKLLADVTADVTVDKNITLDLGGKTLTGTGTSGTATVTIAKGATATVKNGTILGTANSYYTIQNNGTATLEGVTATAGNTGSSMLANWGTLTITSGTYTGGLNVVKSEEGSTLVINGGKFTLSYATNGYTGVIFAYGTTTITGGEFIQSLSTTGKWNHPQVILAGVVEGYTSSVTVTGGSFTNKLSSEAIFRGVGKATSDNFEVSGGTFNKSISDSYCAEGFIPTKNSDGTYSVKKGSYVAAIGSTNYETLEAAITAAKKGKTVKLLSDINTPETTYVVNKSITIDLNGKTVTGGGYDAVFQINAAVNAIIKNGKIVAVEQRSANNKYAMAVWTRAEGCNVTLEDVDVSQQITTTDDPQMDMIYSSLGTITINSGRFESGTPKWTLNCYDANFKAGTAKIIVYGGTFVGFDPNVSPEAKVDGKVPSFVAEGVGVTKDADGNFTAKANMTAQIVAKDGSSVAAYETLEAAVKAATDGQTVKLLANIDSSVSAKYSAQNLTIDLNGYTIKGGTLSAAALKLAAEAVRDANYAVTITSSKDGGAIIGQLPLQLGGNYQANEIKIAIDDSVKLTVLEGGTNAVNQTGSCVYLVGTDTTKAYYKNGGFMVTVNGEDRIYETLGNARSADPNVTLLNDYTTSTCLNIWKSWGAVTLDLDGHTYESTSASGNMFELHEDGVSITFKNGTLKGKAASVVGSVANKTTLLLENVTVDASGDYGIATNGSYTGIKITLNDSSIKAPNGVGVYFPSTGSLTIDGGSILANTGVQVCAGSLNITGGSITATGTSTEDVSSGSILDGAAVSIIKRGGYGALDTLSISGGTFISASGVAAVQTYAVTDAGKAEWTPETGFITGGSFNNIPDNMSALCAEGYTYTMPTDDDPMYYVVKADEERIDVKRSLTLGNTLIMNYKVLLPEGYTDPRIVFESYDAKAGAFYSVPVEDYTRQEKDGETRYVFAFTETNPQRMTDTLKATVYATKDGTQEAFPIDDYSVANYCNALLASDANEGGKYDELVGNLVAYGTAAQLYQNYHTDKLVQDVVNGGTKVAYPISEASEVNSLTEVPGGVVIETKSLVLNNAFAIRVKFTLEDNTTIDQVKFTVKVDGKTTTVESFHEGTLSNGTSCYYFDFADLNSRQLGSTVTFTAVVDGTNNDVLEFSANTYLKLMAAREGVSTELKDLLTTLYSYGCTCGNFK